MRIYKRNQPCKKDLIKIFTEKNIPDKFHEQFVSYYNNVYDEFYEEAEIHCSMYTNEFDTLKFEEYYTVKEEALEITLHFSERYIEQINIGHRDEWAYLVADSYIGKEQALSEAYHKLHLDNPERAKEELLIHCKHLNTDEISTNYLLLVFDQKLDFEHPIERANNYAIQYKAQIESGKSTTYAHQYADLLTSNKYTERYCDCYAKLYEYYVNIGESDKQATLSASQQIESNNTKEFKTIKDRLLERHREYFLDIGMNAKEIENQVNKQRAFFRKL